MGQARGLSRAIASQIKRILEDPDSVESTYLTKRSAARLQEIAESDELQLTDNPIPLTSGGYEWWTYAGLAGNRLLAARVAGLGGTYSAIDSYSICFKVAPEVVANLGGWLSIYDQVPAWDVPDADAIKLGQLIPGDCRMRMDLERVRVRSE